MRQETLADEAVERSRNPTRRGQSLAEMDKITPWRELCEVIEPFYPKPKGAGLFGGTKRIHFLPIE